VYVAGESHQVVQARLQQLMDDRQVELQISVDDVVAKAGNAAKALSEVLGQDPEITQRVDGCGVVADVASRCGREVRRDVQCVLRAELKTAFHGPPAIVIASEFVSRPSLMAAQLLQRLVERQEVTADDRRIGLSGCHRPKVPPASLAASAASTRRSCGR
jgi:hypothetical protein